MTASRRTPLVIDCDTGIDDSLALLYACASPEAEIVAVTCLGGNVDARQVAQNTRAVLELAGRDGHRGRAGPGDAHRPAAGDHARDARARGASGTPSCRRHPARSPPVTART